MQLSNEEDYNLSLKKFESMLKTNKVLFLIRKNLKKSFFIILIWVKPHWQKKRLNLH
jgi:dephospho-CoA kinase